MGIEEKAKRTTPCYTLDFSEEMYDSSELEEEEFCVAAAAAPNPDDYENEEDVDIDSIIKNFESLMESEDSGEIVKENAKDDE